jgi:hypothetical protein
VHHFVPTVEVGNEIAVVKIEEVAENVGCLELLVVEDDLDHVRVAFFDLDALPLQ